MDKKNKPPYGFIVAGDIIGYDFVIFGKFCVGFELL